MTKLNMNEEQKWLAGKTTDGHTSLFFVVKIRKWTWILSFLFENKFKVLNSNDICWFQQSTWDAILIKYLLSLFSTQCCAIIAAILNNIVIQKLLIVTHQWFSIFSFPANRLISWIVDLPISQTAVSFVVLLSTNNLWQSNGSNAISKQFLKLWVLTGFRSTFDGHRIGHINCFTFEQFILLPQVKATEAHNFLKVMSESPIHPIVNNWVHHTVWHC